jgi:hypothetical protein
VETAVVGDLLRQQSGGQVRGQIAEGVAGLGVFQDRVAVRVTGREKGWPGNQFDWDGASAFSQSGPE